MTSSDSFFEEYLTKGILNISLSDSKIPSTHFKTLVLGDLTFDESYDYYLHCLEVKFGNNLDTRLFNKSKDAFQKVFHMTGGRTWFIQDFINQISQNNKTIDSGKQSYL